MRRTHIAILLFCFVLTAAAGADTLTLPASQRPQWLSEEGLVMAGSWEPLPFRVRRDGSPGYKPTPEQAATYEDEHGPEMIRRLKGLGVNFIMMHCYKGGGLELERQGMDDAVRFSKRFHEAGMHVGVYAYSGAFLYEPFFKEMPQARDWVLLDENLKPKRYGSTKYRYYWNRNHPDAVDFYKKIVRFAVEDIRTDMVHLDNYHRGPGFDADSQRQFREYLAKTFSHQQLRRMGIENIDRAAPPKRSDANVFLQRAWKDFSCRWMADSYHNMSRYARSLRKDVLMECNPAGLPGRTHPPVDHGRIMEGGEAIWNEGFLGGYKDGKLHTGIPTYKLARRMGNMVFRYVRNPVQMAESMAFNLDCFGCLCWFEYNKISDYPGSHGKPLDPGAAPFVKFYRDRRELFRDTSVVADVAVLRSYPSQLFGPSGFAAATARAIDELIANRVCFQIICDQHLAELDRYRVLMLAGCGAMSDEQVAHIRCFVRSGGRLCVIGPLATHDEWMFPREESPLDDLPDKSISKVEKHSDLTMTVRRALDDRPSLNIRVEKDREPPLGLCAELTRRGKKRLVHLVNYRNEPVKNLALEVQLPKGRKAESVTLASPGRKEDLNAAFTQHGDSVRFIVPAVKIYEVAVVSAK